MQLHVPDKRKPIFTDYHMTEVIHPEQPLSIIVTDLLSLSSEAQLEIKQNFTFCASSTRRLTARSAEFLKGSSSRTCDQVLNIQKNSILTPTFFTLIPNKSQIERNPVGRMKP